MVEVFIPLPIPVMTRPKKNWRSGMWPGNEVTWMMTPMIITTAPDKIISRRPVESPYTRANRAPAKQPVKGQLGSTVSERLELTELVDGRDKGLHDRVILGGSKHIVEGFVTDDTAMLVSGFQWASNQAFLRRKRLVDAFADLNNSTRDFPSPY